MKNLDTVEYVVRVMLQGGVSLDKIISVSHELGSMFGVYSKYDAEMLVRECLKKYENTDQL
ncbi:hypothetical protein SD70_31640 [Gordoniibacillus kamchatkensis]|uniref:Uncharacterized protein n=1 Tax=Gordoniibacillus kamchatkensis TaxID=1590651 RepID=A0ABR5A5N1_9BACL|nr:hypothetical protein [Paenibacillus sp. VKM B-2647]KIL36376.1 hypothetical protein SD70_31640 [Paenibacillus sp. VKM B-2647]